MRIKSLIDGGRVGAPGGGGKCVHTSNGMYPQNLGTNSECEFGEICYQQK